MTKSKVGALISVGADYCGTPNRVLDFGHLSLLRHCRSILARIGSAIIHSRPEVAHHGLAAADIRSIGLDHFDFVSPFFQRSDYFRRDARLDLHVATLKGELGEARALQRGLDVQLRVDGFRNE